MRLKLSAEVDEETCKLLIDALEMLLGSHGENRIEEILSMIAKIQLGQKVLRAEAEDES